MDLPLLDSSLKADGKLQVAESIFNRPWNPALVHRVSVAHAANGRATTSKQKTRAEVKHTTNRLYRQKGTGRARAGMSSSPIRRGGGRAFPSTPKVNFRRELNRKEFRAGMATVLSQLAREQRLFGIKEIVRKEIKTKDCAKLLDKFAPNSKVLFVDTDFDDKFVLSVRNLHYVATVTLHSLLATDLLHYDRAVISQRALDKISTTWQAA